MENKEHEQKRDEAAAKQRGETAPGKKGEQEKQARINNTRATMLHVPPAQLPEDKPQQDSQGRQLATSPVVLPGGKSLIPGGNNMPASHWEKIKDHPVVKMWMDEGWITEGDEKDTSKPEGPEAPAHLRDVKPDQAMRAVDAENNRDTLERWAQGERRDDVKHAIQRKLESMGKK